ncbi:antitoxin family protein [Egbenema bharatensis]|uniref:antitoxin family protein n=1 Tax=Egbenema bharatensis TaxID=3463334 RepID=UPI003A8A15DA
MQQVVEAVYENGVFRPLKALELSEGQEVQLIIHAKSKIDPNQMLRLAAEVYQGLSDEQIRDVEKIAIDRQSFFGETEQ